LIPKTLTGITLHWLDRVLCENGVLNKNHVRSLTQLPLGAGSGNLSLLVKLVVTYERDDENLPKTMIAKIPTNFASARDIGNQLNAYERETRFYIDIADKIPMRTPKLIYGAVDKLTDTYILILEDCSRFALIDQIKGLDIKVSELIAVKLADFHAAWWDKRGLSSFTWLPRPRGPNMQSTVNILRTTIETCGKSHEFINLLPQGGWEACRKISERANLLVQSVTDDNLTIIHSDFRSDNLFLDNSTPADPLVVFDWQMVQISRGVFDLSYLFGASIDTELRRKIEKNIIKMYHERLQHNGVKGYSFDECWADYLKGWLIYTYILTMAFASLDNSNARAFEVVKRSEARWFSAIVDNNAISVLP